MRRSGATGWGNYLQGQLASRGWSNSQLSDRADVNRSLIGRWLSGETLPEIDSIRRVCQALGTDIREGLIRAEIFTAREMNLTDDGRPDLTMIRDEDLVAELQRRLQQCDGNHDQHPVLMDSATFDEQTAPDSSAIHDEEPPPAPINMAGRRGRRRVR
jgi:transcriptional regulator with XRE-family HTH domain